MFPCNTEFTEWDRSIAQYEPCMLVKMGSIAAWLLYLHVYANLAEQCTLTFPGPLVTKQHVYSWCVSFSHYKVQHIFYWLYLVILSRLVSAYRLYYVNHFHCRWSSWFSSLQRITEYHVWYCPWLTALQVSPVSYMSQSLLIHLWIYVELGSCIERVVIATSIRPATWWFFY